MQPDAENAPGMDQAVAAMRCVAERKYGIPAAQLAPENELSSLGFDSLAFVEYAFELEGELGLVLPDLPRDMKTVGDLARFVAAEIARKQAEPAAG
jgi:acyl carrier protein